MRLRTLYRVLFAILPKQRIPKLPRGMFSSEYESYTPDERRVLARLGARDPRGIKVAMQRYGVDSIDELIKLLKHQQPEREIKKRWNALLCRLQDATEYDPHRIEILRDARMDKRSRDPRMIEVKRRLEDVQKRI